MSNTNDTNAPGRLSLVELTKTFSNTASEFTPVNSSLFLGPRAVARPRPCV